MEISACSLSLQTERQNFPYLCAVSLIDITVEMEFMLSLLSSCCLLRIDNGTPWQVELYCGNCSSFQSADICRVRNNYKQSTTIVWQKPKEYLFASSLECLGAFVLVTFQGLTFCAYFKETLSRQQLLESHCAINVGNYTFKILLNCCFQ